MANQFSFSKNWETEGLGIGLFLCNETIKDHGGMLSLTSDEGEGTKVEFKLTSSTLPYMELLFIFFLNPSR